MADTRQQPIGTGVSEPLPSSPEAPRRHPFVTNPVPIGVAGFALTTFTLGLYTSGVFSAQGTIMVLVLALFYGGLTQFIAGFFALARGDLFPAAFMTTYGAFWFSYVGLNVYVEPRLSAPVFTQAATIFLIMWTVITLIFTLATLGTNWTVLVTFIVFDVALILLDIGFATGSSGVVKAGGYVEMLLAALAWYIVMAEIVNETLSTPIFPLFPFKQRLLAPRMKTGSEAPVMGRGLPQT